MDCIGGISSEYDKSIKTRASSLEIKVGTLVSDLVYPNPPYTGSASYSRKEGT